MREAHRYVGSYDMAYSVTVVSTQSSETHKKIHAFLTKSVPLRKPGPSILVVSPACQDPTSTHSLPHPKAHAFSLDGKKNQKTVAHDTKQELWHTQSTGKHCLAILHVLSFLPRDRRCPCARKSTIQLTGKAAATEDREAEGSRQTEETCLLSSPHTLQQIAGG